ncbi:MAG: outer membrane protein assembly factor BamA [Verrucomicrobiota bacterium]
MKTSLRNLASRALRPALALLFAAATAAGPSLRAQPAATPAAPLKIGRITVRFATETNLVSEQVVLANMREREGVDFDPTSLDRDVRSLYATGQFAQVDIQPTERADHLAVDVLVLVTPKLRVLAVKYEGNSKLKPTGFMSGGFARDLKTKAGNALDEQQVHADAETIRDYYQKAGYNQAKVDYRIDRSSASSGNATVTFAISEGVKEVIATLAFTGNDHVKAAALKGVMETKTRGWFSWLTGSGYLQDDQLTDDLDKIAEYYRELGYLDVKVPSREQITYTRPTAGRVSLSIPIVEGTQFHVGTIAISGNTIIPTAELMRLLQQKTGAVFAPSKMKADATALQDAFGARGYLETRADLTQPHPGSGSAIDIEYVIREGELVHVESVLVEGNVKTKSLVIIRELNLGPGDVFDTVRMKNAQLTLENTRFFDEVRVTDEETAVPGRRNLKIAVKEGQTGAFNFGAGISSLERLVATAEITQGNFDLFNPRSRYQGAGQKFRLLLQLGTRSSQALISFEEPWAFQRRLALGFSIYRTSSSFNSSLYDEIRTGAQVYLRQVVIPAFGNHFIGIGDVEGQLSYTIESVDISKIDATAPAVIKALAGQQTVSKVGYSLTRDIRDRLLNTTSGNRAELTAELAGGPFGADVNYYRLEARGSQFFKLADTQTQVLGLVGRLGVIENYGSSTQVPFYDRYFLGGPYTLRGFDYREVGPKDPASGEPIGGKSYGFISGEYSLEIVNPARIAIFYDAGFVNAGAYDFSLGGYNADYGFGLRLLLNGAPLNLDFGFPVTTDKFNNKGMRFNFSIGTRF